MVIVLQSERLDWNQISTLVLKCIQISKIKLNLTRITDGGVLHYKMTRKEPNQHISTEMSSHQ